MHRFSFFFLFSCCNIVERGFSFQAVFLDSLKAECCESQNCGRHYTNIMCMFVLIPLKTFREEKDQMLHHFTVTFLADTCKNYEPKKKRKRMGGRQYYWFLHERNALFSPSHASVAACSTKPWDTWAPLAHSHIYTHLSAFYTVAWRLLDDVLPAHTFTKQAQL